MSKRKNGPVILLTNLSTITNNQYLLTKNTSFLIVTELHSHVGWTQLFHIAPQVEIFYTGVYLVSSCPFRNHWKGLPKISCSPDCWTSPELCAESKIRDKDPGNNRKIRKCRDKSLAVTLMAHCFLVPHELFAITEKCNFYRSTTDVAGGLLFLDRTKGSLKHEWAVWPSLSRLVVIPLDATSRAIFFNWCNLHRSRLMMNAFPVHPRASINNSSPLSPPVLEIIVLYIRYKLYTPSFPRCHLWSPRCIQLWDYLLPDQVEIGQMWQFLPFALGCIGPLMQMTLLNVKISAEVCVWILHTMSAGMLIL